MIVERLQMVRARIADACREAGRSLDEVGLVAVSKTHPSASVEEAYAAGQRIFGENKAQELRDKAAELSLPGLQWHFIGRLQTNKAKYVAPVATRVHALDDVRQAQALSARAPGPLGVLVAVNLAGEASKGGVAPSEALALCARIDAVERMQIKGLMCIPPYQEDPEASGPFFAQLADLAARGRAQGLPLTELSMGMSHDCHVAVRHGATWVRVGTAIFGRRR